MPFLRTLIGTANKLLLARQSLQSAMARGLSSAANFADAQKQLKTLKEDPGNQVKLKLYGLFKQATVGKTNVKKPGMLDMVGKAKWDAWNSLGDMSQTDAEKEYIRVVNELLQAEQKVESVSQSGKYKTLLVTVDNGLRVITLNRPDRKNAISIVMYNELIDALKEAAEDDNTTITAFTGAGSYYCSGNDLKNMTEGGLDNIEQRCREGADLMADVVSAFIDFPKPLIGVVNGPAIGISVTLLGLFDVVYASDKATFNTPFSVLGMSPEGCSSYTFPKIMGYAKANEFLLFNKTLTAQDACDAGLVAEVFPDETFLSEVWPRIKEFAKLPKNSLRHSKTLIRQLEKDILHKVNREEAERLYERWQSDECMTAIMTFFSQKSKL